MYVSPQKPQNGEKHFSWLENSVCESASVVDVLVTIKTTPGYSFKTSGIIYFQKPSYFQNDLNVHNWSIKWLK